MIKTHLLGKPLTNVVRSKHIANEKHNVVDMIGSCVRILVATVYTVLWINI